MFKNALKYIICSFKNSHKVTIDDEFHIKKNRELKLETECSRCRFPITIYNNNNGTFTIEEYEPKPHFFL